MIFFFFKAEDGIRVAKDSRGLGDVKKRKKKRKRKTQKKGSFSTPAMKNQHNTKSYDTKASKPTAL